MVGKRFERLTTLKRVDNPIVNQVIYVKEEDTMRKFLIIIMIIAMGWFFSAGMECFAADEIKVGAVQPITGRFAFAGVQINQGLEDALNMANELLQKNRQTV